MNREPPKEVLDNLRREVNFGCPVPDCGVPYLTWHHFDPPWATRHHHEPQGMIALCATHHELAEGAHWTPDQLRGMKRNPFIQGGSISEHFGYLRKTVICRIGNLAYNPRSVLQINGEQVIGFNRDAQGYNRLNVLARGADKSIIMEMKDDFWTVYLRDLYDLRCPAQGRELEIRSKDQETELTIRFDELSLEELHRQFSSRHWNAFLQSIGNPKTIPVWTVRGKLRWGGQSIEILENEIIDMKYDSRGRGNILVNPRSGFSYNEEAFKIG